MAEFDWRQLFAQVLNAVSPTLFVVNRAFL
jgi:hypothetical protein